ncbi:MAG: DNA mismatch endonuclease Vsr [Chloroflexota bacterium]|nr:DNA mismatch endonuclease Vsr [Chloroflexota bacterium]
MFVRRSLHRAGFRYRLHSKSVPGRPDLLLRRYRTAVFVHGCFWHGHSCKIAHTPRSNSAYWTAKLQRNMQRDQTSYATLESLGWRVCVVWECSLEQSVGKLLERLEYLRDHAGDHATNDVRSAECQKVHP